jgi:hypothetical protein
MQQYSQILKNILDKPFSKIMFGELVAMKLDPEIIGTYYKMIHIQPVDCLSLERHILSSIREQLNKLIN